MMMPESFHAPLQFMQLRKELKDEKERERDYIMIVHGLTSTCMFLGWSMNPSSVRNKRTSLCHDVSELVPSGIFHAQPVIFVNF